MKAEEKILIGLATLIVIIALIMWGTSTPDIKSKPVVNTATVVQQPLKKAEPTESEPEKFVREARDKQWIMMHSVGKIYNVPKSFDTNPAFGEYLVESNPIISTYLIRVSQNGDALITMRVKDSVIIATKRIL